MNGSIDLIDMMFCEEPLEAFQELLRNNCDDLDWGYLLHMCYCEESYESVGGDFGDEDNPPFNYERPDYLKKFINSTARITTPATPVLTKTAAAEKLNERLKNRLLRFAEQPVLRAC